MTEPEDKRTPEEQHEDFLNRVDMQPAQDLVLPKKDEDEDEKDEEES